MMAHWHAVLPGRVLDVQYEDVVADQQGQTRRLLDFCGLPWEDACLRFHETERAIRTASSEQVRRPIYDSSIGVWRHYDAQLAPLIEISRPRLAPRVAAIRGLRLSSDRAARSKGHRHELGFEHQDRRVHPVAYAVSVALDRQLRARRARPGSAPGNRPRCRDRHRAQARGDAARHPAGDPGDQPAAARAGESRQHRGLLALRAELSVTTRRRPAAATIYFRGVADDSVLVHRRLLLRDLSRRAAADAERAAARDPPGRHRAHRGAARAAGHALRLELAVRDAALHHEQAGSERFRVERQPRRYTVDDGDEGYDLSRRAERCRSARTSQSGVVGFSARDAGFIDNVFGDEPRRQTFDNADFVDKDINASTMRAVARRCAGSRTTRGPWTRASSTSRWTPTPTRKTTS